MPNFIEKHKTPMPTVKTYGIKDFYEDLQQLENMAINLSNIYSRVHNKGKKENIPADSIVVKRQEYDELRNSIVEKTKKGITQSKEEQDKINCIIKWIDGRRPTELLDNLSYIQELLQDVSKNNSER